MIHSHSLNENLWAEAVNTAVYVLNRTGTSSIEGKSPYEVWHGQAAKFDNFKVFGSIVYSHIPEQKRRKFDKKSEKCLFVGYGENVKGIRVYNTEKCCIQTVRDVIFGIEHASKNAIEKKETDSVIVNLDILGTENDSSETAETTTTSTSTETSENASSNADKSDKATNTSSSSSTSSSSDADADDSNQTLTNSSISSTDDSFQSADDNDTTVKDGSKICNLTTRNVVDSRTRSGANFCSADIEHSADICCAFLAVSGEPQSYSEAMNSNDSEKWQTAMREEYESLIKNNTWKLVDKPKSENVIDNKWVYKIKHNSDGTIDRHKARLVARGFTQCYGINFKETFSPVVRFQSIRAIFAVAAIRKMKLVQFDIKTAFLYGELAETIYMKQPLGYDDGSGKVCKLIKSLYMRASIWVLK